MNSFDTLDKWLDAGKSYNSLVCCDCMEAMKHLNDKQFDLSLVDPPYGRNIGKMNYVKSGAVKAGVAIRTDYSKKSTDWDAAPPDKKYFDELFRISKNQIIWGANNFELPRNYGWIFWDKVTGENDFGDGELAWTSFDMPVRKYSYAWNGMIQGDMKNKEIRIHPNQKPRALYRYLLSNYAENCETILDTHAGSCSSCIEFEIGGFQWIAFEKDTDYFNDAQARMKRELAQYRLDLRD